MSLAKTIIFVGLALAIIDATLSRAQEQGLVISIIDAHLEANPLCEGGPGVCKSGRSLMVVLLNMSNQTYDRATLVCWVVQKGIVIEKATQEIQGPILPRRVNVARGQPRDAPALVDRAMADAVVIVEFTKRFPPDSQRDIDCTVQAGGGVWTEFPPPPPVAEAPKLVEVAGSKIVQYAYETDVQIELIGRSRVSEYAFIRLRCQIFDADDKAPGTFDQDFTTSDPSRRAIVMGRRVQHRAGDGALQNHQPA